MVSLQLCEAIVIWLTYTTEPFHSVIQGTLVKWLGDGAGHYLIKSHDVFYFYRTCLLFEALYTL